VVIHAGTSGSLGVMESPPPENQADGYCLYMWLMLSAGSNETTSNESVDLTLWNHLYNRSMHSDRGTVIPSYM